MPFFKGKRILITGGTGSLGKVLVKRLLSRNADMPKKIIVFSRDEAKQHFMNYCGIDGRYLDYVVDDAPAKQGFFTPGTHVPIKSWDFVKDSKFPEYAVMFAWAFADEVIKKRQDYIKSGGKFIIPLPKVRIFPE